MNTEETNTDARERGGRETAVLALIGPTAVGKTALSLEIAEKLGAEVISVDSRQVYRYMDIGTDKVSPAARREVPHHLIDVADPDETFTAASFAELAGKAAARVLNRGRLPLFVGGTPFYYRALFHAALSDGLPGDRETRARWERLAESEGSEALHRKLAEADAAAAARLHPHDVRRVSRALEIFELTGVPPSRLYAQGEKKRSGLDVFYIGLTRPRAELYENIAARVKRQFASGYPEEVAWLMDRGFDERFPSMQGFGYRELAAWRRGALTLEEALEGDIRRTKAFCRRQMTWFGKFVPTLWYDVSEWNLHDLRTKICGDAMSRLEGRKNK
ncbi:MAG: tRNA (adenosine(37)-N6)-dimethylallyltransferase MiaA [Synergistaceae bacterium]|jgi:tRNA dimethylallyltransferase|nr:tRNA (adenosine(37)-N6)-dimethylallyltransferase MiaA [Synergistaceae bacterium]